MRILYLYIFLFSFLLGNSQNLVPNPSFETYTICPSGVGGQIESAIPWTAATTNGSTDYFNACSSPSTAGVPRHQGGGFQYARTGNAYAGLVFATGASNAREYLQVQLSSPLIQNKNYYVEFYVNSASFIWTSSSCNNIAANLSVIRPSTINAYELQPLTPHIMNPGNPVINDTLNWIQVSGCYLAQGGEEYLTIGNFFDNANTQITSGNGGSYYYVDDVRVEEMTSICVTNIKGLNTNNNFNLLPNPASDLITISSQYEIQKIELVTITGALLLSEPVNQTSHQLQLQNFAEGIYFVKVVYDNGMSVTKKVVVNH